MIASLPMYDRPETQGANDRFWQALRDILGFGPDQLERTGSPWDHWRSGDLLFSQTCGLPFRSELHKTLHLVGTADHALPDCAPGYYRSALVVRKDDPRKSLQEFSDARFAYNSDDSQSGWAAPSQHFAAEGLSLSHVVETGGHRISGEWVATGKADIAALDAVTWRMMGRWDGFAANLRVLDWTRPTPALPFVTANPEWVAPLQDALPLAIEALGAEDRETLCLAGSVRVSKDAYLAEPLPEKITR